MTLSAREQVTTFGVRTQGQEQLRALGTGVNAVGSAFGASSLKLFALGMAAHKAGRLLEDAGKSVTNFMKESAQGAMQFDHDLRLIRTQLDMTRKEYKVMSDAALEVAKNIPLPMKEITEGLYDILSSTDTTTQAAIATTKKYAKATVAGASQIRTVARSAITTQNAFNLTSHATNRILDQQFTLVRKGQGDYNDFVSSIGDLYPSARAMNQTLGDSNALWAFASRTLGSTSKAAISVARAMDLMRRNADDMKSVLGIDIIDKATGQYKSMIDIIGEMAEKMDGMTSPERAKALYSVFSSGEIRANRFFNTAIPNFEDLQSMMDDFNADKVNGAMQRAFDIMRNAPLNTVAQLRNHWEAIKVAIGKYFFPAIRDSVKMLEDFLDWFDKLPEATKKAITGWTLYGGVVLTVGGKILTIMGGIVSTLSLISLAAMTAGVSLGALLTPIAVVLGGILALAAVGVLVIKNWENIKPVLEDVWIWAQNAFNFIKGELAGPIQQAIATFGAIWDDVWTKAKALIEDAVSFFQNTWQSWVDWFNEHSKQILEAWEHIKTFIGFTLDFIKGLWDRFGERIMAAVQIVWDWIKGTIQGALKIIQGTIEFVMAVINGDWGQAWDAVLKIVAGIWDLIWNAVKFGLRTIWEGIKGAGSLIWGAMQAVWNGVIRVVQGGVNWGIGLVEGFINKIVDAINWVRRLFGMDNWGHISLGRIGGEGMSTSSIPAGNKPGELAKGTKDWRGGPAIVGEKGPELVYLPKGASVIPNHIAFNGGIPGFAGGLLNDIGDVLTAPIKGAGNLFSLLGKGAGAIVNKALSIAGAGPLKLWASMKDIGVAAFSSLRGWFVEATKGWMDNIFGGSGALGGVEMIGKAIQNMGYAVSEHPAFGGVTPGAHTTNSYHYSGRAVDVNWYPTGVEPSMLDKLYSILLKVPFKELLWRVPDHFDHLHLAMAGGGVIREPIFGVGRSGRTYSFGENGAETVTPGTSGGDTQKILHYEPHFYDAQVNPIVAMAELKWFLMTDGLS